MYPRGIPFLDLCIWKGRFPSTRARFCTFELKHRPIDEQIIQPLLGQYDDVVSWQGVRAQESASRARLPELELDADNQLGLHVYRPLLQWTHDDVFALAKRHGIPPNLLYQLGCSRVGYIPMYSCAKKRAGRDIPALPGADTARCRMGADCCGMLHAREFHLFSFNPRPVKSRTGYQQNQSG